MNTNEHDWATYNQESVSAFGSGACCSVRCPQRTGLAGSDVSRDVRWRQRTLQHMRWLGKSPLVAFDNRAALFHNRSAVAVAIHHVRRLGRMWKIHASKKNGDAVSAYERYMSGEKRTRRHAYGRKHS